MKLISKSYRHSSYSKCWYEGDMNVDMKVTLNWECLIFDKFDAIKGWKRIFLSHLKLQSTIDAKLNSLWTSNE